MVQDRGILTTADH